MIEPEQGGRRDADPILVTGASGYVGSHLVCELLAGGHQVRAMTRHPDGCSLDERVEVVQADASSGEGLDAALDGCETAFYLIHSMGDEGDGDDEDFAEQDDAAAANFARAAKRAGVGRVIYLGGLAGDSAHLRSREATAATLAAQGPELVHARAAVIVGPGSDSFEIIRHLVDRLPVLPAPEWVDTRTQPIAIDDAVSALVAIAERETVPAEIELGGADVLSYAEMMRIYAEVAGKHPRPVLRVPGLGSKVSAFGVSLITPVEHGIAEPLIEGLGEETCVKTPPPPGINEHPMSYQQAVDRALAQSA